MSIRGDNLPADPDEAAQQAKGKELQRRQQTLDLKALSTRFTLTLQGTSNDLGSKAYIVAFEPKPNQPYHSQTEKVLNQLHGRIWVRASDDTILRTQATLLHPVRVAWIFASITRLDFHYELPAGGSEYGPAWLANLRGGPRPADRHPAASKNRHDRFSTARPDSPRRRRSFTAVTGEMM